jgi:hypothetical protein
MAFSSLPPSDSLLPGEGESSWIAILLKQVGECVRLDELSADCGFLLT